MSTLPIQFGDSSSGIGALGVDGKAFVLQLITFVLVFLVLKKWAFQPILKLLQERRDTIEEGVRLGEVMRKDKVDLEQKIAAALHDARAQADKILADAHDASRQAVQEAEEAARKKADGILAAAEERIKQETSLARRRLQKDLADLVAEATEAIIHEKVDAKKDAALISRALKEQQA